MGSELSEVDGKLDWANDVGGGVAIIDLKRHTSDRLVYCETYCGYDEVAWVSRNRFVIMGRSGHEQAPDGTTLWQPDLWIYDLDTRVVNIYRGPSVRATSMKAVWPALRQRAKKLHPISP